MILEKFQCTIIRSVLWKCFSLKKELMEYSCCFTNWIGFDLLFIMLSSLYFDSSFWGINLIECPFVEVDLILLYVIPVPLQKISSDLYSIYNNLNHALMEIPSLKLVIYLSISAASNWSSSFLMNALEC